MASGGGYAPYPLGIAPASYDLRAAELHTVSGPVQLRRTPATSSRVTVFIHGLNGSWRTWMPMLHAANAAGLEMGDIAVVDFSRLRHLPRTLREMSELSQALNAYIDQEGWTSVDLVGHSTGGSLAAYLASAGRPGRVNALRIVAGLFVRLFEEARTPLWRIDRRSVTSMTLAKLRIGGLLGPVTELALKRLAQSSAMGRIGGGLYAEPDQLPKPILEALANNFSSRALRDTLAIGRAYYPDDIYPAIKVPARLVVGASDPLMTAADAVAAAGLIDRLDWTTVAGAGHFPQVERPDETVRFLWQC